MLFIRLIVEGFRMAGGQLWSNKLRSFLSLLGISIGIFCIISVLSAVDSLQKSIMAGFSEFGSEVVYLDKQPWTEDPGENYWKYLKRPNPSYKDYEAISRKSKLSDKAAFCFFSGAGTLKYEKNSLDGAFLMGSTPEYPDIQSVEVVEGRLFTPHEYYNASNVVVIGNKVKEELFGELNPVGREIKMLGQKFRVIGVLKEEGDNPFNFLNFDEVAWTSLNATRKFFNVDDEYERNSGGQLLVVHAAPGTGLEALKDEVTGIIRGNRKIKPFEEDNFAVNQISMLEDVINNVFGAINVAGFVIGIFALIVGMISVANIMFVSVKERTNQIGVKKALGARRAFILIEFLLEAIFLCLVGGVMGLIMVALTMKAISSIIPFEMWMSYLNLALGLTVSIVVGILSGMIPAFQASKMDPVEAMRS